MNSLLLFLFIGQSYALESILDIYVYRDGGTLKSKDYNISFSGSSDVSLRGIYDGPVVILFPSLHSTSFGASRFTAYFAFKGINSVPDYPNFRLLHEALLSSRSSAVKLFPGPTQENPELLNAIIEDVVLPDNFRAVEVFRNLLQIQAKKNLQILFVAPKSYFDSLRLAGLKRVAKFLVDEYSIEPISSEDHSLPVVSRYSPQSSPPRVAVQLLTLPVFYSNEVLYRRYRQISP